MAVVIYIARVEAIDGVYTATFPDLPGLSLQRDSIPTLLQASRERLLQSLKHCEEEQGEWPQPTPIEGLKEQNAGELLLAVDVQVDDTPVRINISLGEHFLKRLDAAAEHESMSRSGYIAAAVRQRLKQNSGKPLIDDVTSHRLYQDVVSVGRRVHETLGPDSPIGKTLTELDNRALDGLRKLAEGVGAAMQLRPREPAPFTDRSDASERAGGADHPEPRDNTANPKPRSHMGHDR